ncbi:MAG TPA: GDSL-type esterase/lipase family protein [Saprospiraceae bacterium]|nr:GDSL-type esterase/lipase family protein [Saprospiraceae bacterium]
MKKSILLWIWLFFISHPADLFAKKYIAPLSKGVRGIDTFPHYPFIDTTVNRIISPEHIQPFLRKLKALKRGQQGQVRIAHLGDSHVQADFMSTRLRHLFQKEFGNAGRGLVFFYAQADTHGPLDLQTDSPQEWTARRRIFQKEAPAIGISGMGIASSAATFSLGLSPKKPAQPLRFNKVTLFHDGRGNHEYRWERLKGEDIRQTPLQSNWRTYRVQSGDTLYKLARQFSCTPTEIKQWNNLNSELIFSGQELSIQVFPPDRKKTDKQLFVPTTHPQSSLAYLPEISSGIRIHGQRQKGTGEAQLYGLLLEDETSPGVLFNMMGVNGATYYHFNHAEHFTQQMGYLQADLILITLGTNEAIQSRFYPGQFRKEVTTLLQKLKGVSPQSQLVLMTNPSVLVNRKVAAPYTLAVRDIIREVADQEGAAVWDWYAVMGGRESIRDWRQAELAYKDFIHFTEKGYILQARLLFDAIMKEYRAGY